MSNYKQIKPPGMFHKVVPGKKDRTDIWKLSREFEKLAISVFMT